MNNFRPIIVGLSITDKSIFRALQYGIAPVNNPDSSQAEHNMLRFIIFIVSTDRGLVL